MNQIISLNAAEATVSCVCVRYEEGVSEGSVLDEVTTRIIACLQRWQIVCCP